MDALVRNNNQTHYHVLQWHGLESHAFIAGKSYVAAGFVKWIEAAGARAVPIRCAFHSRSNTGEPFSIVIDGHMLCRFYATDAELKRLFKSINGIIFPVSGTAAS